MSSVRPEDRLFSLVLALLSTETGLTKSQIFTTVRGYENEYRPGIDSASLERKFERDKTDLRELGIPIETIESPEAPGDNTQLRYRISKDDYELPAEVSFSAGELALLTLAAEVWREGIVSEQSRRALLKLRSFDLEPDAPILGYAPRLKLRENAFDELNQAIAKRATVRFDYLKPGAAALEARTLSPFALAMHEGRWHVRGFDHDRAADRTFLLSRIMSPVKAIGPSEVAVPPDAPEALLAGLAELYQAQSASLLVRAESTAAAELGNRSLSVRGEPANGWLEIEVHYTDEAIFAEELAGCGPEVRVQAPAVLAEAVQSRLVLAAERHATGGEK